MTVFGIDAPILLVMLPVQIALSLLVWFTSSNLRPRPALLFTVLSTVMAILWIYIEANFVMDFL